MFVEKLDARHEPTLEVGSEGGSPGDAVEVCERQTLIPRGSEATEIAPPAQRLTPENRRGEQGRTSRRPA
jgi:hypothetical protein